LTQSPFATSTIDGGRRVVGAALFVAALYERRIISLSEISSDGHRPPLQKNAKNYLSILARGLLYHTGLR
jgi:hypothetical protein